MANELYDDDEWSLVSYDTYGDRDCDEESFCILSSAPSVCSISDVSEASEVHETQSKTSVSEPNKQATANQPFQIPPVKRKSRFRYGKPKRIEPDEKQTFSLGEISRAEDEIYAQNEDKSELLTSLATQSVFFTSFGKIDVSLWKFMKSNLVERVMADLFPRDSAKILWLQHPPETRSVWLQDKQIYSMVKDVLEVNWDVPKHYLQKIQTMGEFEMFQEKPWRRAVKLGNLWRIGYEDPEPCGWTCMACTFRNPVHAMDACEMCGTKNDYPTLPNFHDVDATYMDMTGFDAPPMMR